MAPTLAPTRNLTKIDIGPDLVGMARFELAASCSQSRRANQAAPHPVGTEAYRVVTPAAERLKLAPER